MPLGLARSLPLPRAKIICSFWGFGLKMKAMESRQWASGGSRGWGFRPFEGDATAQGFKAVAGVDEVGRGPLAGPVVAAAVILPRGFTHSDIKDSKMLSATQREMLAPMIQQAAVSWALGIIDVEAIDRLNILRASLTAMAQALRGLSSKADMAFIDGNQQVPAEILAAFESAGTQSLCQRTIVKGDQLCLSIAAASIVAKVARDRIMIDFDRQYPEYGFAGHKGYGTPAHLAALQRYGPTPIHRRSFKPVRELLDRAPGASADVPPARSQP
jgi:ribonuclease HII